ncbi:hypothetical protein LCGC14_2865200, partial [marine sediment metagenome]
GKPLRTMGGLVPFVNTNESSNVINYPASTALTWLQAGEDFIDESLEQLFRFGGDTRLAVCGSGTLLGIMRLVKLSSTFNITPTQLAFGISVMKWVTPFGTILLKRHPLFTYRAHRTNDMLILDPDNIKTRPFRDTRFKKDPRINEGGYTDIDGVKEEWLTELTYEYHWANTMMYLTGIGLDGTA